MKKGFTLIEVLVSVLIFALVIVAAYQIYDHSQKTYLLGEQLTDVQQSTRFAFEKLSHDLRIAGFRVYPDSDALRPDLPIEGMWSGAIALRADFDGEPEADLGCTLDGTTHECVSGTGQYGLVTTGNQDIRVYVLAKKAGQAVDGSNETLRFSADFSQPRDAVVGDPDTLERVTIPGVSLNQDKPPYKLYMVTFRRPSDSNYVAVPNGGDVPAANLVWTPIADGIFSMEFEYYNQNGIAEANQMDPDPADIAEPADRVTFRRTHGWPFGGTVVGGGSIAKNVVLRLIGMTARADARYTDPLVGSDTSGPRFETKGHRKYELASTINMLNVGVAPHELADTVPPDDPTQLEAVVGYCGGALLSWEPSRAQDLAVYWIQVVDSGLWTQWGGSFKYNCDDAPNTCVATSNPEDYGDRVGFYVPYLDNGAEYHARVFAQDNAGNFSRNPTNQIDFTVEPGPLKPLPPTWPDPAANPENPDLRPVAEPADYNGLMRLKVNFTPPREYDQTQNPACVGDVDDKDGRWPAIRDLYGYRLYHRRQISATPVDFAPLVQDLVADELNPAADPLKIPYISYPDIKACPCEYYAFKMKAVTLCTDADDDMTQSPPCLHAGEFSLLSHDGGGNPAAVQAPQLQDAAVFPQIVPAQPLKPTATAVDLGTGEYQIALKVLPVLSSALKGSDGTFTPNPDPTAQFEVWRYRIYEYAEDPAVNPAAAAVLVDDPTVGGDDFEDWDANLDGGAASLGTTTTMTFTFTRPIPSGQQRWYAVAGIYRCADGATMFEGQRSIAASVPCETLWDAAITSPMVDYTLVSGGSMIWPVVVNVWNIPGGLTISEMKITISGTSVVNQPLTPTCGGTTCTATYNWNLTGLPDGNYGIMVQIADSSGCATTVSRIATIANACAGLQVLPKSPFNNELTWELRKVNGTEFFLLDKIGFTSQTYQATSLTFYESDPTAGAPPAYPLWTGGPQDLSGRSVGASFTSPDYIYSTTNYWCDLAHTVKNPSLNLNPRPGGTVGASNWFRFAFDKNLTSANGPLNLLTSLYLRPCGDMQTHAFTVLKKKGYTFTAPAGPICAFEWTYLDKEPTLTSYDLCTGTFTFMGANSGNSTVTLKIWLPSGTLTCPNMPVLMGP